ncbi:TRNA guanosine-2'-O-methyltransferase TRM11-like protein [Operophtera brumata]|uniref:tRNA guanosine-2'-O-methyltransferase TRM11-like protein n=1 Tax=Operophtera brumata TaxID=104452 RepID=A0A0L7KQZ1_OPEBR|nr:TRNA guanosine-2'-O-methyltransferase TRM11-like protein [Operophtera brumata]
MWRRYLLWFAQEHVDFRHAEMQSILDFLKIPINYIEKPSTLKPYWIVEFPSEECAKQIASRSVSMRNCVELWSRAKTETQLHKNLFDAMNNSTGKWIFQENLTNSDTSDLHICPKELIENCCSGKKSFKVDVETFCKHFTMKEKVDKIEKFAYLPLEGPIKLNKPEITLCYIEFYGMDPNNVPENPCDVFFGKWFIGNTSMDAQLAILMANQAQVRNGDVILDPFVGSGSLFVAASHFGAYVWGSDIDFMLLHGRTRPTRVGQKRENYSLTEEHLVNHVPAKVEYVLPHIYSDLLGFAAREEYAHAQLPAHPCMQLVANSEQVLSRSTARRLLTNH